MAPIAGPSHEDIARYVDEITWILQRSVRTVVRRVVMSLQASALQPVGVLVAAVPVPTVDDVAPVRVDWTIEVDGKLLPYVEQVYHEGAAAVSLGLKMELPAGETFTELGDDAGELYLGSARNRLVGIGDGLWTVLRDELLQGMREGESNQQLAARLQKATGGFMGSRQATVIARTEVHAAANRGAIDQLRATGLDADKEWLATRDLRTRPTHRRANGQTVDLDGKFVVGGVQLDHPGDPTAPGDEVIQCRCTAVFHLRGEHDQRDHGNRGEGAYKAPNFTYDEVKARALWGDYDVPERFGRDMYLEKVLADQGFTGRPELVSNVELDEFVDAGERELFRGVSRQSRADDFMSDKYFGGTGLHGNGIYTVSPKNDSVNSRLSAERIAKDYARSPAGQIMRMTLRKDAKLVDEDELDNEMTTEQARLVKYYENQLAELAKDAHKHADAIVALFKEKDRAMQFTYDPGRFAAARGYDAYVHHRADDDFIIILNRTAVRVARDFTKKMIR
jgi:SPP1 gp7 family putative phage head morphogenesis protein